MSAPGTVSLSFDPPGLIEHTEHGDVFTPDSPDTGAVDAASASR